MALSQNANLTVLKLGYNNLGDVGVETLASGIATHKSLTLLDLGFNNIGDIGIKALAIGMQQQAATTTQQQQQHKSSSSSQAIQTLYLAGNLIGGDGAMAIADFIRNGSQLRKLYMTGNRIGGDGVKAITEAILEDEMRRLGGRGDNNNDDTSMTVEGEAFADLNLGEAETNDTSPSSSVMNGQSQQPQSFHGSFALPIAAMEKKSRQISSNGNNASDNFHGMQELFLGGTGMGSVGCQAVSRLLEKSSSVRVISLPNCDMGDEEVAMLASSIKQNKDKLPIQSIQLSFNRITHKGLESLTNALWGSSTLKDLEIDNNEIGDQGAHHIAAVVPGMTALRVLDVGFNSIKVGGINVLMKTIAESQYLESFSISGNAIDVNAAKAVAYAMAYNCSLTSIHLVHCSIGHEGQRHISAGIVSNSRTALRRLTGFEIGRKYYHISHCIPLFLFHHTLFSCHTKFCCILFFLSAIIVTLGFPEALKHWTNEQILNFIHMMWKDTQEKEEETPESELERDLDPLSFLSSDNGRSRRQSGPLDATIVVEVAKRAFDGLVANGVDVFSRRPTNLVDPSFGSPLASGAIMVESSLPKETATNPSLYINGNSEGIDGNPDGMGNSQPRSFVAPPESQSSKKQEMPDPVRKKKIVEWLCTHVQVLNDLAQMPFDSRELWKLHQHYFTPVVNESGGSGWQGPEGSLIVSSVPEVFRGYQGGSAVTPSTASVDDQFCVPMSDPVLPGPSPASIPMLKRKVSFRFLGDAGLTNNIHIHFADPKLDDAIRNPSVAKIIEQGHTGHSLPPKTKRARRNRTRISFLPRIKAKLDSYLDVCHDKALITMRQLYFVERALLGGQINPVEPHPVPHTHLSGILASEAEMIIVDMI